MARPTVTTINTITFTYYFFVAILSAPPDAVEYLQHLVHHLLSGIFLPENSDSIVSHFIFMKKYLLEKILS